jgi:hypothetical protein
MQQCRALPWMMFHIHVCQLVHKSAGLRLQLLWCAAASVLLQW